MAESWVPVLGASAYGLALATRAPRALMPPSRSKPAASSPTTFVALLRGINVGGKNSLPMKALAELWAELGATDVRTYIQSGNVVYRLDPRRADDFSRRASVAIEQRFGFAVPLVVRDAKAWARVAASHPFAAEADPKSLHVVFLAERPKKGLTQALDSSRSPPDQFQVSGGEIYLCCPNGIARTKLTNAYFDRVLQTTSTVRNWATVLRLQQLSAEAP